MQIWRMPADGAHAVQITTAGASHNPSESADGKKVYYHVLRDPGEIWSIPVQGGEAVKVAGPTQRFPVGFAVTAEGIYYGAPRTLAISDSFDSSVSPQDRTAR